MNQKFNIENDKIDSGFSAPNNYFNELEVAIQNRISQPQKVSFFNRYKYALSGVATCIIGLSLWLLQPQKSSTTIAPQQTLDYAMYINDNIEEFDEELIYESYAEASNTTSARAAEDEVYSSYLIDNDIDENTLMDEL
ncbi:MAG: hypothetical protein NT150_05240 [Bacteroidetes bacterium]|nr:hypothetical protein [Bacteroidota bacterium]